MQPRTPPCRPDDARNATGHRSARHPVAAALAVLLAMGLAACTDVDAKPPSKVHVYLVRGVFNVFSLGMDEIAFKLKQQGIEASVNNHLVWEELAADAATNYKSGQTPTIILVGHSQGATLLPNIVERLDDQGVPVALAVGIDSVFPTKLRGHVGRYLNIYASSGPGRPVEAGPDFHGKLENVDVKDLPGIGHVTIDKNEVVQQKVIDAIDAVALPTAPIGRAKTAKLTIGAASAE